MLLFFQHAEKKTLQCFSRDVEVVSTEKDLGVVIVNDTSWKDHILMIVAKANSLLGFIRRSCAGIVGSVALLHLYCSLMHSHFCYCSQL